MIHDRLAGSGDPLDGPVRLSAGMHRQQSGNCAEKEHGGGRGTAERSSAAEGHPAEHHAEDEKHDREMDNGGVVVSDVGHGQKINDQ